MSDFVDRIATGDIREQLTSLRDLLADRLAEAEPRESAPLARQLVDVLARIAALPGEEKSTLDDLTARRAKRRASVQEQAAGKVVGGE